ncbi:hypothetical protein NEOLEDRAFT_1140139 [Neolentinus lepideus HHB14362 ss-1]|uniref:Uncharacterized protein n=1 Tax=Neolentinus lepideus HHB14362 ss-1 TaxID=1314782 RepID=A0A165PC69_9AGAM|nr:hypothetical protein NEOLEDRAFT_1140139 [Neolentinus lepideus HHB14362 ss-1]
MSFSSRKKHPSQSTLQQQQQGQSQNITIAQAPSAALTQLKEGQQQVRDMLDS